MPPEREARFHPAAAAWSLVSGVGSGILRLVPHPMNFMSLGAASLFAGARLPLWAALLLPLTVMAVTDYVLYRTLAYDPFNAYVYASFLAYVLLGRALCRDGSPWRVGLASLLGSVQFFLVSNFSVWLHYDFYAKDLRGLLTCYAAGLPFFGTEARPFGFFGNLVASDLLFTALLFGAYAVATRPAAAPEAIQEKR